MEKLGINQDNVNTVIDFRLKKNLMGDDDKKSVANSSQMEKKKANVKAQKDKIDWDKV